MKGRKGGRKIRRNAFSPATDMGFGLLSGVRPAEHVRRVPTAVLANGRDAQIRGMPALALCEIAGSRFHTAVFITW